jgi:2-keto-4-pentenoate hydratase/2-oxohepta-3-ene-1,7-dioic acid hydratase in catechol pathway
MRLVTFDASPGPSAPGAAWQTGILTPRQDAIVAAVPALAWWRPTNALPPPAQPMAWLDRDGPWFAALARLFDTTTVDERLLRDLGDAGCVFPLDGCRLWSPVPRPGKIVAVGLNYRDHAAEARMPVPDTPVLFAKFPSAVVGPEATIVLPASSRRVDYEAELAVVIGRRATRVAPGRALEVVAGFMNANDVSERDFQKTDGQWVRAKSCDTFAPMGPWLVTADEVPDPNALRIQLRLNGAVMQDSSTKAFVFDVARLLSFISETVTLEPGDVILTGTPPGVGFARRPPVFLSAGDVVEVEIEGLGILRNPVDRAPW